MTQRKLKTPKQKRRTCCDRLRTRMLETRRRRQSSPATSAVAQLAALFAIVFGRMPVPIPLTAPYTAPPLSPGQARRNEIARRLGVPARYVDVVLAQGRVPYTLLFDHIRGGGAARGDAMDAMSQRVPEPALDWLVHIRRWGLWSDLQRCYDRGTEEETDIKILKSTLAWLNGGGGGTGDLGPDEPGISLTPGGDSGGSDPEDDPSKPKP